MFVMFLYWEVYYDHCAFISAAIFSSNAATCVDEEYVAFLTSPVII